MKPTNEERIALFEQQIEWLERGIAEYKRDNKEIDEQAIERNKRGIAKYKKVIENLKEQSS